MPRRLKPSDVGYHGNGTPDPATIARLQSEYSAKIISNGSLSPEIMAKLVRMRELAAKGASDEAGLLALELLPHLHFKADDVDWALF